MRRARMRSQMASTHEVRRLAGDSAGRGEVANIDLARRIAAGELPGSSAGMAKHTGPVFYFTLRNCPWAARSNGSAAFNRSSKSFPLYFVGRAAAIDVPISTSPSTLSSLITYFHNDAGSYDFFSICFLLYFTIVLIR